MCKTNSATIQKTTTDTDENNLSETLTYEKWRNIDIVRERKVPTVHSQLHVAKIGDVYRWKAVLSTEYLNNAQYYITELYILANKWITIKNIIQNKVDAKK